MLLILRGWIRFIGREMKQLMQRMQVLRSYREAGPSGYPAKVTTTIKDITGTAPRTLQAFAVESWPRLLDIRHP